MEKTFTTREVIDNYNALEAYVDKDVELTAQLSWDIEDNLEEMKKVCEKFEKHRSELIQPLQDKGAFSPAENGQIKVADEYKDEFLEASAKIDEYLDVEVTLEIKTAKKAGLPEELSVKDIRALKFMISE